MSEQLSTKKWKLYSAWNERFAAYLEWRGISVADFAHEKRKDKITFSRWLDRPTRPNSEVAKEFELKELIPFERARQQEEGELSSSVIPQADFSSHPLEGPVRKQLAIFLRSAIEMMRNLGKEQLHELGITAADMWDFRGETDEERESHMYVRMICKESKDRCSALLELIRHEAQPKKQQTKEKQ